LAQSSEQVGKSIEFTKHYQDQTQPVPNIPQNMNISNIQNQGQVAIYQGL